MKSIIFKGIVGSLIIGGLWSLIGVERIVGDHEIGVSLVPFIKHRPSLQIYFKNPIQNGLDITPIEELSPPERMAFIEFCNIRFGVTKLASCYTLIFDREI